jgi:hypothetical protein
MLNPKDHPKNIVTVSATGNGDYFLVQDAIDFITDESSSNRYSVQVYPGVYTENIVMKDYVSLVGVGSIFGDVKIQANSGTLITGDTTHNTIENITLRMEPTASGAVLLDMTSGGDITVTRCILEMESATNGVTGKLIDGDCDEIFFLRSDMRYTMTGSSAGANTHSIVTLAGSTALLLDTVDYRATVNDVDDNVVMFDDAADALSLISHSFVTGTMTNAAHSGDFRCINRTINGSNTKFYSQLFITLVGSGGTGTGTAITIDSDTNNATVDLSYNNIIVAGFGSNYSMEAGTGDTVNSNADTITAADDITGAGDINFVNASAYGSVTITGGGAFTIDTTNEWHALSNLSAGSLSSFTEIGGGSTGAITAYADAGGGQVTVTSAGHGLAENDYLTITGSTNYNGVFKVTNVTTDTFEITDTWVADDGTGTWHHGSHIVPSHRGDYKISWAFSASAAGANKTFDFASFNKTSEITGTKIRRNFQTAAAIGSIAGEAIVTLERNDHLFFAVRNVTDASNITISEGALTLAKIS